MSSRKLKVLRIIINKFYQSPIAVLGFAFSVILAFSIWYFPTAAALLHRYQGERSLETATRRVEEDQLAVAPCDREPVLEPDEHQALEQALIHFEKALTYGSKDSGTYLKLGRVNCYLGNYQQAVDSYRVYTSLRPQNPLGHLELAFTFQALCTDQSGSQDPGTDSTENAPSPDLKLCQDSKLNTNILRELKASGVSSQELFQWGEHEVSSQSMTPSLVWYDWAVQLDPKNDMPWKKIGKQCQRFDPGLRPEICDLFWSRNSDNFIVDAEFTYPYMFEMWDPYDFTDGTDYGIENCPGIPEKRCASITITDPVPEYGAGLYQCLNIQPGKTYRYGVWIEVQTNEQSQWRPLYYQGSVGSATVGKWFTNQFFSGPQTWSYYEFDFVAPVFDGGLACFHPIRLQSEGRAWFHSPELKLIQESR